MTDDNGVAGPRTGRRNFIKSVAIGTTGVLGGTGGALVAPAGAAAATPPPCPTTAAAWPRGIEGQRRADMGDGRFLNPILAGDRADPTVLKDGDDYYMTYSSFEYYPAIVIWHSRDLVNWTPIGPALKTYIGSIWALDLIKHNGRYYIYIPAVGFNYMDENNRPRPGVSPFAIHVIHADDIRGPWSEPVNLNISGIDPGHVVGEDGKRYLFINDGRRIRLTDDGLATVGELEKVYEGWKYPEDWVVEAFALEGPKFLHKDGWIYMITAEGGTAGPPTSHMVVVARSRSVHGPWENCPHNPIVRTASFDEPWWSRGHATIVQGPKGDWWMVYHAYEHGFRTLGRQILLDPIEWTADGWPRAKGGDLGKPLPKPSRARARPDAGVALSDDLTRGRLGTQLAFFAPKYAGYLDRARFGNDGLTLKARGKTAGDSSPLALIAGDRRYQVDVEVTLEGAAEAGLLLFYSPQRFYCGLGFSREAGAYYSYGTRLGESPRQPLGDRFHLRVVNDREVASFYYSRDGAQWTLQGSLDVAGYNHNAGQGFLSLRPALYAAGEGQARFRNLRYTAL